jgi:hypothetical protein
MLRKGMLCLGLAALLGGAVSVQAQTSESRVHVIPAASQGQQLVVLQSETQPAKSAAPIAGAPNATPTDPTGCCSNSCGSCGCDSCCGDGPTLPENVKCLQQLIGDNLCSSCGSPGLKLYGWIDAGYTYASTGPGLLTVETRENRFGNEFLVNQIALVLEKRLNPNDWSLGFKSLFYAGADAALLRPEGGFTTTNPRFGVDFRELYVSAHLPILTDGGVDVKAGRMGTIIGYESAMAPYRPFYSNDYQWFYAQDGAFTGALATVHVNKQLDVIAGVTMGANTFFTMRGDSPCFIGQINYWTDEDKNTLLSASTYMGHEAIFAAPQFTSSDQPNYTFELRLQHKFNKCWELILQSDNGWANEVPVVGTGSWFSFYAILLNHFSKDLDINFRAEWFDDEKGTRTGFATNYYEATFGLDYHPVKWLRLRPEVRGDFADDPVFRNGKDKAQLTLAIDGLLSF